MNDELDKQGIPWNYVWAIKQEQSKIATNLYKTRLVAYFILVHTKHVEKQGKCELTRELIVTWHAQI
jgi:hypothetical protein